MTDALSSEPFSSTSILLEKHNGEAHQGKEARRRAQLARRSIEGVQSKADSRRGGEGGKNKRRERDVSEVNLTLAPLSSDTIRRPALTQTC